MAITGTTPIQAFPIPLGSDSPPDIPLAFSTLAGALEQQVVMVFNDTAARDAAFPGGGGATAAEGMLAYLRAEGRYEGYDGAAWIPLVYGTTPACAAYMSAGQSHTANATYRLVAFDAHDFDSDTMHSTTTNNSRVYAKTGGLFQVNACLTFDYHATGLRVMRIKKNAAGSEGSGTVVGEDRKRANDLSGNDTVCNTAFLIRLATGDYLEMFAYQNSGANLGYTEGRAYSYLHMARLSA